MDTRNDSTIPECGDLSVLTAHKTVVGAKQIRKALEKGTARLVCLAKNADPAITGPLETKCKLHRVPCVWISSKEELGHACGIDVGAAAAAAVD